MPRVSRYVACAILLLAFGLRVYHLAFQASMSDDALALTLARENPFHLLVLTANQPHAPTHYFTLSLWTRAAGLSEYAGRFYSLLFSLGSTALMFVAGRRLVNRKVGVLAAFLFAINPLDVYFGQYVRMYSMLTFLSLASSIFAYQLIAERGKPWRAYVLTSFLAVMTHPFALWVLFAQAVAALLVGPREWRWLRAWAACQLGVVAAFTVWLLAIVRNLSGYTNDLVSAPPLWTMLWTSANTFMLGFSPGGGLARLLAPTLIALAAIGAAWLASRRRALGQRPLAFLLSYLLAPFVLVWAISFVKPLFFERYMVICLPPALLLAAVGVVGLESGLRAPRLLREAGAVLAGFAVLAIAVATGSHLSAYYRTPVYATSDDMRGLAAYVSSVPNPVVVTNVPAGDPLYGYYLPSSLPVDSTLDLRVPGDFSELASQHRVIWFLPFGQSDHQRQAFDWLQANTYPADSRWFGNAQVLAFASPPAAAPATTLASPVAFGDGVQLAAVSAPPLVRAGDPIDVTLRWQASAKPNKDYSVFVHLLDSEGRTASQHDSWPAGGARPTTSWQPGQPVDDRHGLLTMPSFVPGAYRLEVGLYDSAGQRLATSDGRTSVVVGTIEVG